MAKVSIIMPTYNRSWAIERAIQSVLNQTFTDWELIIVDDGSTDSTRQIIQAMKLGKISYYYRDHKGVSAARNFAIGRAKGKFMAYLDTDNIWFPHYLERMMDAFPKDGVLAYSGQNLLLVEGAKIIGRQIRSVPYNPAQLLRGNYIDVNCTVHLRRLFDEVGMFDEALTRLVDWDLFVRISFKYPYGIHHVNEVLSEYHYYLKDWGSSVTNEKYGDEIRRQFGWRPEDENDAIIRAKIARHLS